MKGKTCLQILFICLVYSSLFFDIQAQSLKAEYWEKNWESFPRPVYNYGIPHFTAVKRVVSRKYFSSNSGFSGELYQKYYQFQYPNAESIAQNRRIKIRIPPRERLLDVDYRIWKNNLLIYEARSSSINSQIPAHLINASLHSDSFYLAFDFLEPECIVELIVSCKGVPLPYQLFFNDDMPIEESLQELIVISESPLRYKASSAVEQQEKREWDNLIYSFKVDSVPADGGLQGIETRAISQPFVRLDWQDQIYYYDREETDNWPDLLRHIFYEGPVRDYSVYRNSLSEQFGWQQFYGPWQQPLRYYRDRNEQIISNEVYAQGNWRLSREYADRWLQLENLVTKVKNDSSYTFRYALQQMHSLQEKAIRDHLQSIPEEPKVFTEYGLIYSFYQELFKHFEIPYRLALVKSAASGALQSDYISPWQFQARALAYQLPGNPNWLYIFAGPILGDFALLHEIPSPFSEGQALLFNPQDSFSISIDTLNFSREVAPNFIRNTDINFNESFSFFRVQNEIIWNGVFRSKLLQDYLLADSLDFLLVDVHNQLPSRHWQGDSITKLKNYRHVLNTDSITFTIPIHEILSSNDTSPVRLSCLPYLVKAKWNCALKGLPENYRFKIEAPSSVENEDFTLSLDVQELGPEHLKLSVAVEIRRLCYDSDSLNRYLQILSSLNEGVKITIWKK